MTPTLNTVVAFTPSDLASSNELEAGWYPLKIESIQPKAGKSNSESTTFHIKYTVRDGHPKSGTPVMDYPNTANLEKGLLPSLIRCFDANVTAGKAYDIMTLVGKNVDGWCVFEDKDGFRNNKLKGLRPAQ